MTVPTKAAMKQLLDERMIAGSASNWLPPAMFFLQLNLSGVIILLSLMFYANALGESFVRGLVVVFCSSLVWCMCGYVLWLNVCTVLGGSIWQWCVCMCVVLFFKHSENICIPLNPACVALIISCMHQGFLSWRSHGSSHITRCLKRRELVLTRACLLQPALFQWRGEDKTINEKRILLFLGFS